MTSEALDGFYSDHETSVNNVMCFWLANQSSLYAESAG